MLHIDIHGEKLSIELEGKKLTQGESFVCLGGAVCGVGNTGRATTPPPVSYCAPPRLPAPDPPEERGTSKSTDRSKRVESS